MAVTVRREVRGGVGGEEEARVRAMGLNRRCLSMVRHIVVLVWTVIRFFGEEENEMKEKAENTCL